MGGPVGIPASHCEPLAFGSVMADGVGCSAKFETLRDAFEVRYLFGEDLYSVQEMGTDEVHLASEWRRH